MARLQDNVEREFVVSARLSKTPPLTDGIDGAFSENDGGSYFLPAVGADGLRAQTSFGTFEVKKNRSGELSFMQLVCLATSVSDARRIFQLAALPFLDRLAYIANCPVVVAATRIEDRGNQCTTLDYISPYRTVHINSHAATIHPEMAPVYAMYREAQNSHSDFYKFLCYYKILEGILGRLRADTFKAAKDRGITLQKTKDVVPETNNIPEKFKEYVGNSVKIFFDSVMTPEFRNAVAHFVTDDGAVLNMSSPAHIESYSSILIISELCAREVIKNHEKLVAELHEHDSR